MDRTSGSKQERVRDRVRDLVAELPAGAALPAERRLAERFDVARMTLRRAVDELVGDGVLVRRQGSGTYVAHPKRSTEPTTSSFSEETLRHGMVPSSRTLSEEELAAGAPLGARLGVSPSERVRVFRRLRSADRVPMALETLHVCARLVPDLTGDDLERTSFYELLRRRYGLEVSSGVQTIEPTVANEEEARLLGIPEHAPAFLFELTTRTHDGRIVEFVRSVHRGDRLKLSVELRPADGHGRVHAVGAGDGLLQSATDDGHRASLTAGLP